MLQFQDKNHFLFLSIGPKGAANAVYVPFDFKEFGMNLQMYLSPSQQATTKPNLNWVVTIQRPSDWFHQLLKKKRNNKITLKERKKEPQMHADKRKYFGFLLLGPLVGKGGGIDLD